MKKIISFLIIATLLSGCGTTENPSAFDTSEPSSADVSSSAAPAAAESPLTMLDGNYTAIDSAYLKEADAGSHVIIDALQFDEKLIVLWIDNNSGPVRRYAIEAVDAKTGTSLYFFAFDVELPDSPRIEKTDAAPYDYRINYRDKIEYKNSADKDLLKTVSPPDSIEQNIWDSTDLYGSPFDADLEAGLIAYSGDDGIYLCDMDGGGNQQFLSNADAPALLAASEMPDHDASQLKYALPLLMNGGKQLVASIYLMTNGNYDTAPFGVTLVDIATGETQSRTDIVWLSHLQRLTSEVVGYISNTDGFMIWNAETKETRAADFNWHEANSFDFITFIQSIEGSADSGEPLHTLYSFTLENPDDKKTLLTLQNGKIRWPYVTQTE